MTEPLDKTFSGQKAASSPSPKMQGGGDESGVAGSCAGLGARNVDGKRRASQSSDFPVKISNNFGMITAKRGGKVRDTGALSAKQIPKADKASPIS